MRKKRRSMRGIQTWTCDYLVLVSIEKFIEYILVYIPCRVYSQYVVEPIARRHRNCNICINFSASLENIFIFVLLFYFGVFISWFLVCFNCHVLQRGIEVSLHSDHANPVIVIWYDTMWHDITTQQQDLSKTKKGFYISEVPFRASATKANLIKPN